MQKSKHWDQRQHITSFLSEGYPFSEGYPKAFYGKTFTIITRSGTRHSGALLLDFMWRTKYGTFGLENIIAWCEEVV